MKLYYIPGVSSLFPHIALREAGSAFELMLIKVDEQTKLTEHGKDYREVNPLGFLPALELADGTILTEGVAIAQYVADQAPSKQLAPPNGTLARTKLQSWLNFIDKAVADAHRFGFSSLGDDPALLLVFLLVDFAAREALVENVEGSLLRPCHVGGPIPIARISGTMTRKAMTMKITIITGPMNIPNQGMYCHQSLCGILVLHYISPWAGFIKNAA
jgi:hypothetical protein